MNKTKIKRFTCNICKSSLLNIGSYDQHQQTHANLGNIQILCLHSSCHAKLTSYKSLRMHVYHYHKDSSSVIHCCKIKNCNKIFSDLNSLHKHVRAHIKESSIGIPCPLSSCSSISTLFSNVSTYTVHVFRKYSTGEMTEVEEANEFSEKCLKGTEGVSCEVYNFSSRDNNHEMIDNLHKPSTSGYDEFTPSQGFRGKTKHF